MKIKCPKCKHIFSVDEKTMSAGEFVVACPQCSQKLRLRKPDSTPATRLQPAPDPEPKKEKASDSSPTLQFSGSGTPMDPIRTEPVKQGKSLFGSWAVVILSLIFTIAVLFFTLGRNGPPKEDIEKASRAKAAADAVKAADYANAQYLEGIRAMTEGEAAVKAEEWDKAKRAYMVAAKRFYEASTEAPAKIKDMADAATVKVADLKKIAAEIVKDKSVKAALRGKDGAKFQAMLKEANYMITEGERMITYNAMGAIEKLTVAAAKFNEVKMMAYPVKRK